MKGVFYSIFYAVMSIVLCLFLVFGSKRYFVQSNSNRRLQIRHHEFSKRDTVRHFELNTDGSDVIVYVRIQKTGSTTFIKRLTTDLDLRPFCNYSILDKHFFHCENAWKNRVYLLRSKDDSTCGIHADWTHLQSCAVATMDRRLGRQTDRRYLYITTLREPYARFVSEWLHVSRGATWRMSPLICNGKSATKEEVPDCYQMTDWQDVDIKTFFGCASNLAINRQTRMTADLTLVNCYNMSTMNFEEKHHKMLASAKDNLRKMAYFGLMEYQELSQILFENTFNLKFISKAGKKSNLYADGLPVPSHTKDQVLYLNKYDVMLYNFAKDLFFQRVKTLMETTDDLELKRRLVFLNKIKQ